LLISLGPWHRAARRIGARMSTKSSAEGSSSGGQLAGSQGLENRGSARCQFRHSYGLIAEVEMKEWKSSTGAVRRLV